MFDYDGCIECPMCNVITEERFGEISKSLECRYSDEDIMELKERIIKSGLKHVIEVPIEKIKCLNKSSVRK